MVQTATGCTPYKLVYDLEAVLPLEAQLPSLSVDMQFTDPYENTQIRLAKLEALDERRLIAQQMLEIYQVQMAGAFNKRVKFRSFSVGDLVLTIKRTVVINRKTQGNLSSNGKAPKQSPKSPIQGHISS